jgi:hypothetical protein
VLALSASDVWAVGAVAGETLAEHWNGKRWQTVSTPLLPPPDVSEFNRLDDIDGVGANDIWAVGRANRRPLIEHWNGTKWRVVSGPSVGPRDSSLTSVDVVSRTDAWAVGPESFQHGGILIEHWDGRRWKVVKGALPLGDNLSDVAAHSRGDAWAVGVGYRPGRTDPFEPSVGWIEHWNGRAWSVVQSQWRLIHKRPYAAGLGLNAVSVLASRQAWAVGSVESSNEPLIERWDGSRWSRQSSPPVGCKPKSGVCGGDQDLEGVVAISPRDIWAVGSTDLGLGKTAALIEHYSCTT